MFFFIEKHLFYRETPLITTRKTLRNQDFPNARFLIDFANCVDSFILINLKKSRQRTGLSYVSKTPLVSASWSKQWFRTSYVTGKSQFMRFLHADMTLKNVYILHHEGSVLISAHKTPNLQNYWRRVASGSESVSDDEIMLRMCEIRHGLMLTMWN